MKTLPVPIDQRDEDPYPTDEELDTIKNWDFRKGWKSLVEYVECLWWMPAWGFKLYEGKSYFTKKNVIKLQLHTGGWSGNESVIEALEQNYLFWNMSFYKLISGGHYWFEIRKENWKERQECEP